MEGENRFRIAPLPGGTLSFAESEYRSPYGMVKSSWKKEENGMRFRVSVPSNCTAVLRLPDGSERELLPGDYEFCTED